VQGKDPSFHKLRATLNPWLVPLILLIITFIGYGLFVLQQGFHWDDWGFAWMPITYGLPGLIKYYSYDRPLLAYFVYLTSLIIGPHPLGWQVFGMLARWASTVTLWWVIRIILPNRKRLAFWTAVFFLLYPGFRSQTIANAYGHYLFIEAGFFLSLGLMLKALQSARHRWLLLLASLILALPNLFLAEYFAGYEILRPVLLWISLRKEGTDIRQRFRLLLSYYLPFLAIFGLFLYWRFFLARSLRYGIDVNPGDIASVSSLAGLIQVIVSQWVTVSINAWLQILQSPDVQSLGIRLILIYGLILIAAMEGWVYFSTRLARSDSAEAKDGTSQFRLGPWLGVGALAIAGAQIPFLVSHLTVKLQFPYDRFTLPFALGVALLLAAVLELIPHLTRRMLLAGVLAVFALGFQIQTSYAFRSDWNLVKYYLWQLSWRMPGLKPGTVLLSTDMPFQFSSDNSLSVPINWIYDPALRSGPMQYLNLDLNVRTKAGELTLVPGQIVTSDFRVTSFASTTDHVVVLAFHPPGCLRVLDPQYDRDLWVGSKSVTDAAKLQGLPFMVLPYLTAQTVPLSNMQQIDPNPAAAAKPMDFLYPEPAHNWCYYFEKADLARQWGDWLQVAKIGDQAFAIPFHPDDLSEYLPFIEAYLRLGRWKDAHTLTVLTADSIPLLKSSLCLLWKRVQADASMASVQNANAQISKELLYLKCLGQ
jgi:hypothetical protein